MGNHQVEHGVPGGEVRPRGNPNRRPPPPAGTEIDHRAERVPWQQVHLDGDVVRPVRNVEPSRQRSQGLGPQDGDGWPRELEIGAEREPAVAGSHDRCTSAPRVERGDGVVGRHPHLAQEREVREVTNLLVGCGTEVRDHRLGVVRGRGVDEEARRGSVSATPPLYPRRRAPFARCTEPGLVVVWHIER
jgi:hypothetical protein